MNKEVWDRSPDGLLFMSRTMLGAEFKGMLHVVIPIPTPLWFDFEPDPSMPTPIQKAHYRKLSGSGYALERLENMIEEYKLI